MNTPKQRKRYAPTWPDFKVTFGDESGGKAFGLALSNPEYAALLGRICAAFEHLEDAMARVLAVLLNDSEENTAGYLLRSLKAPRARFDLMHNLLTLAPQNKDLGDEYDKLIDEYWELGRARNAYVHGRWFTREDGVVFFATVDEHGWTFMRVTKADKKDMEKLVERIAGMHSKIMNVAHADLTKRRLRAKPPPQAPEPPAESGNPKGASTAPPTQPKSSAASPQKRDPEA